MSGIASVSSAATALRRWTPSSLATDLMAKSTARHATARNGDLTATVSLAALDSFRPMACRKILFYFEYTIMGNDSQINKRQ